MMKNLLFSLAFMLVSTFALAGNSVTSETFNGKISITGMVKNQKSEIILTFDDFNSFNEFDSQQLNDLNADAECTASVEVTVTVSVVSASATVKAEGVPCEKIGEKIKELKQAVQEALK